MFEKLILGAIPVLLAQVAGIPLENKKRFAAFISDLCALYIKGDQVTFQIWLGETGLSEDIRQKIMLALWTKEHGKNDHGMSSDQGG